MAEIVDLAEYKKNREQQQLECLPREGLVVRVRVTVGERSCSASAGWARLGRV